MRAQSATAPPGLTEQIVPKNLGLTPQAIRCRRSATSKSATSKSVSEENAGDSSLTLRVTNDSG